MIFLRSKHGRDQQLADALARGINMSRDVCKIVRRPLEPCEVDGDLVAFVGMHNVEWWQWLRQRRRRVLYLDKGYHGGRKWPGTPKRTLWRASVDTQQPLDFVATARMPTDRWKMIGKKPKRWRVCAPDAPVVIANSHEKYHKFYGLPHPTTWVEEVVAEVRRYTDRPIWYRPKPGWTAAVPIEGLGYRHGRGVAWLAGCHALVTHGSYISLDAMLAGVPTIALGPAIVRPISSTDLAEVEHPHLASDEERMRILSNMSYLQYTLTEWADGTAWRNVKRLLLR